MLLYEFEAKRILSNAGLLIPEHVLIPHHSQQYSDLNRLHTIANSNNAKYFVKAQVLHGNRADQGLILAAQSADQVPQLVSELFTKKDQFGQPISSILVELAHSISKPTTRRNTPQTTPLLPELSEYYLSLRYDTVSRGILCSFSKNGGTGMDERGESLVSMSLSALKRPTKFTPEPSLLPTLQKLWEIFTTHDATLIEINPLVPVSAITQDQITDPNSLQYICLDAKIELEDAAAFRHPEWDAYPKRSAFGRPPTEIEQRAHAVSRSDHRGVAGESFFEISHSEQALSQPRIGIMASGGGASTLIMDALMSAGVLPANYTEYSGNPTRQKVAELAKVVLSLPDLSGLFVVGSNANFTDIYETLAGVVDGFLESNYNTLIDSESQTPDKINDKHTTQKPFVILIRRGGPRWQEAFDMVTERLAPHISANTVLLQLNGPDYPLLQTAYDMKELLKTAYAT